MQDSIVLTSINFFYKNPYDHTSSHMRRSAIIEGKYDFNGDEFADMSNSDTFGQQNQARSSAPIVPELPPRIDRASKPNGVTPPSTLLPNPSARNSSSATTNGSSGTYGRSAHERLFAGSTKPVNDNNPTYEDEYSTRILSTPDKRNSTNGIPLERKTATPLIDKLTRTPSGGAPPNAANKANGSYDSVSSYDSSMQNLRLGPNAPDDLKSVPNVK